MLYGRAHVSKIQVAVMYGLIGI